MRDNPQDPYGKLLVIAGDKSEDLLIAARSLVTRNNAQSHVDAVSVSSIHLSPRREYDAPRWLDSGKPTQIGTYTTAERLTLNGSGSVNIYFRLPPDLFLQSRDSVPLLLKFSYAGVAEKSSAALHIRVNDETVDSIQLRPASANVDEQETVRVPTGRLQPYTNTLTIDADFGHLPPPKNVWQYVAIHRESTIDLSKLPHSVILPRLELFRTSGYPFTAFADLSRTAVVLPPTPLPSDYESLLDMVGFFGAQTGAPATQLSISDGEQVEQVGDKDLVVLGTPESQPLFARWAADMPVRVTNGLRLTNAQQPSRMLHPEWPFRTGDRRRLEKQLATGMPLDLVVEDFVSPLREDRSVVAIVPQSDRSANVIAAMFTPWLNRGPIYGGVSIAQRGWFQSFLVGTQAYRTGQTGALQRSTIFLIQHYLLIPPLLLVLGVIVAVLAFGQTERVAARRLALERNVNL
jgi:cellulose synthase (UDP-forming)